MIRKAVNQRIEELRKDLGLTQTEFAEKLGLEQKKGRSTVSNWEQGLIQVKSDDLILIAKTFNVSADYLLGLSDAATADKDLQFICDYTGLSMAAVETLRNLFRPGDDWPRPRNVDYLSDFISECGVLFSRQLKELEEEIKLAEFICSVDSDTPKKLSLEDADERVSLAVYKFEKACRQIPARIGIDVDGALSGIQNAMIGGENNGKYTEN